MDAFEIDDQVSQSSRLIEDSYIVTFKEPVGEETRLVKAPNKNKNKRRKGKIPFGEPSTGQGKQDIADQLELDGEIIGILASTNAIFVKMSAKEAYRLSRDKRVLRVDQNVTGSLLATQTDPGWGLDRLDEQTATLDDSYDYTFTGAGRTVYVLDSGLTLSDPEVAAEFGGRASVLWDSNVGGDGRDCLGHGTGVSSIIAGNTYGVAKGATLVIGKITNSCFRSVNFGATAFAVDWLADNAPTGSIINLSAGFDDPGCSQSLTFIPLESAIKKAHDAGIIVVVAAGNDRCNTANYTPSRIPEAFVVGGTNSNMLNVGLDSQYFFSRKGWNISAFAPAVGVSVINQFGDPVLENGTSFSAPYISGIFAIGCQIAAPLCDTTTSAAPLYDALRSTGTLGTVTNFDGSPLTGSTSRFISQQW